MEKGFGIGELKEGIDSKCNDRRGTACKAGLMGGGCRGRRQHVVLSVSWLHSL